MIMVTVMYPATDGVRFDMDYYLKTHVPMVDARWRSCGLQDVKVLHGVGAPGGGAATYSVIALLTFGSAQEFQRAVEQHGKEILGDIANFTDIQPIIQINDVIA